MHTNQELIDHLVRSGVLRSPSLIDAFEKCDRILFVPKELHTETYGDYPLQIGEGQTISQPTTVAIMLEMLHPRAGDKILDIGSGSGWTTALLAAAVGQNGLVEGIERVTSLVEYGRRNLQKVQIANASIELADSSVLGKPGHLYDRILISASAPHMPTPLFDQLKPDGILVIPVKNSIWRITKDQKGKIDAYELPGFRFVPLITPS
ncbi:MAG: protein-L-isoaspartate O-methyltransferase [Sulfuricurvum sp.]|nr:protein-L-isoaspartate O-methyltransferase [Sulfuricurvum sp.]MDP3465992.1 protein-L-isoaspartate O-methyltransferase [Sulfuricurvum sp.]